MFKKLWHWMTLIFSLITGAFLIERMRRKNVEAALEGAEYDKNSALLDEKLKHLSKEQAAAIATAEVEKNRKLSKEELLKFLNDL